MDGEWQNCLFRNLLTLSQIRHLELCDQVKIEPLPVVVEFTDAMVMTGFVPRARIPLRLLIEQQQITPIPSEHQEVLETTIPDVEPLENTSQNIETAEDLNRSKVTTRAASKASNAPTNNGVEQGTKRSLKDSSPKKILSKLLHIEVVIESRIDLGNREFGEDERVDIRLAPTLFGKVHLL